MAIHKSCCLSHRHSRVRNDAGGDGDDCHDDHDPGHDNDHDDHDLHDVRMLRVAVLMGLLVVARWVALIMPIR